MASYTIDTNVFIDLNNQIPRDLFPSVWENIEQLADENRACVCREVMEELARGGDDLHEWVSKHVDGAPCEADDSEVATVAEISRQFKGWVSGRKNEADPWVVAHAKRKSRTIVTNEGSGGPQRANHNQKIPHVASMQGVEALHFFDMARQEGWQF